MIVHSGKVFVHCLLDIYISRFRNTKGRGRDPLKIFEKIFERERAVAQRVGGFEWVPDILPLVNFYSFASGDSRDMWQYQAYISETGLSQLKKCVNF